MKPTTFAIIDSQRLANCLQLINGLPTDGTMEVVIQSHSETRRDAQNKLMWHWKGEVKQQKHISSKFAHGQSKLEVLLPLMYEWGAEISAMRKRAEYVRDILDCVPDYETKVFVAFDMVRTRDLSVSLFASYLSEDERFWANQGVVLTTSLDFYDKAMGIKR